MVCDEFRKAVGWGKGGSPKKSGRYGKLLGTEKALFQDYIYVVFDNDGRDMRSCVQSGEHFPNSPGSDMK